MPPLPSVISPVMPGVTALARIPEHSVPLMCVAARGTAFQVGDYLFVSEGRWLAAIGYPLRGGYSPRPLQAAIPSAMRHSRAQRRGAAAPRRPGAPETPTFQRPSEQNRGP